MRRRRESHVMGPGLGSRCVQLRGIVIRHEGYAGGGDTTLGLYKLQDVAVEEGLFVLELRLAAAVIKSNIDHLKSGPAYSVSVLYQSISLHNSYLLPRKYAASRPSLSGGTGWPGQRRRSSTDDHRHPVLHGFHIRHWSMPLCPANGRRRYMWDVESGGERLL